MIMFPVEKKRKRGNEAQQVVAKQRQDEGRPVSAVHEKENVLVNRVKLMINNFMRADEPDAIRHWKK